MAAPGSAEWRERVDHGQRPCDAERQRSDSDRPFVHGWKLYGVIGCSVEWIELKPSP
jgi:hypothetical protein